MATIESFHVTVEGPGLKLDQDVSLEIGKQIAILVLSGESIKISKNVQHSVPRNTKEQPIQNSQITNEDVPQTPTELSIREFLIQSGAKRVPDKITAIAFYLKVHKNTEVFSPQDISTNFEMAAEPRSKNLSRDINWAVKNGWIAPKSGDKGRYYLTNAGTQVVEAKFPADLVKKTKLSPQKSKKKNQEVKEDIKK